MAAMRGRGPARQALHPLRLPQPVLRHHIHLHEHELGGGEGGGAHLGPVVPHGPVAEGEGRGGAGLLGLAAVRPRVREQGGVGDVHVTVDDKRRAGCTSGVRVGGSSSSQVGHQEQRRRDRAGGRQSSNHFRG